MKSIGQYFLGIGGIVLLLLLSFFVIKGTVWVSERVMQPLIDFGWIVLSVNILILLPLGLFKKTGMIGGMGMAVSSYVFGLILWILGLLVTYFTWGFIGMIVGLALGGVGVVPIAMIASLLDGNFSILMTLIVLLVLTLGIRFLGVYLGSRSEESNVIEHEG